MNELNINKLDISYRYYSKGESRLHRLQYSLMRQARIVDCTNTAWDFRAAGLGHTVSPSKMESLRINIADVVRAGDFFVDS